MNLEKPKNFLRLFFQHKVPWWMQIVRPVVLSVGLLLGVDNLVLPNLPGRALTTGEVAMLQPVFKDAVDYKKVRIHHSKGGDAVRLLLRAVAITRGNTIIESDDTPDYSAKTVPFFPRYQFTHEMTHVWQNQNHVSDSFTRTAARTLAKLNPWDTQLPTYTYSFSKGSDLTDFPIEQQASIVPDYTYLVRNNVQSPLSADAFASGDARKAAYESVLKKFNANPAYPRRK